jgi:hypothetical protein
MKYGNPYSMFNKVDYQIRNPGEIDGYIEEIRNQKIPSGQHSCYSKNL